MWTSIGVNTITYCYQIAANSQVVLFNHTVHYIDIFIFIFHILQMDDYTCYTLGL